MDRRTALKIKVAMMVELKKVPQVRLLLLSIARALAFPVQSLTLQTYQAAAGLIVGKPGVVAKRLDGTKASSSFEAVIRAMCRDGTAQATFAHQC